MRTEHVSCSATPRPKDMTGDNMRVGLTTRIDTLTDWFAPTRDATRRCLEITLCWATALKHTLAYTATSRPRWIATRSRPYLCIL